jgi:hypothetical protein
MVSTSGLLLASICSFELDFHNIEGVHAKVSAVITSHVFTIIPEQNNVRSHPQRSEFLATDTHTSSNTTQTGRASKNYFRDDPVRVDIKAKIASIRHNDM